jgi:gluconokinase
MTALTPPRLAIVMMGVSGNGKSTVGAALAAALGLPFIEGDTLHSAHNVEKMSHGIPLDDADRAPWLAAIAARLADTACYPRGLVITCSALKASYRERLRAADSSVRFVFLDAPESLIAQRLALRSHHFMPASLLSSQFQTLEDPRHESDVLSVDASGSIEATLQTVVRALTDTVASA